MQQLNYSDVFGRIFDFLERTSIDKKKFWNKVEEFNDYKGRYKHMSDNEIHNSYRDRLLFWNESKNS